MRIQFGYRVVKPDEESVYGQFKHLLKTQYRVNLHQAYLKLQQDPMLTPRRIIAIKCMQRSLLRRWSSPRTLEDLAAELLKSGQRAIDFTFRVSPDLDEATGLWESMKLRLLGELKQDWLVSHSAYRLQRKRLLKSRPNSEEIALRAKWNKSRDQLNQKIMMGRLLIQSFWKALRTFDMPNYLNEVNDMVMSQK